MRFRFSADDRADILYELPGREELINKIEGLLAEFWPSMDSARKTWKRIRDAAPLRRKRWRAVATALRRAAALLEAERKASGIFRFEVEHEIDRATHTKVSLSRFVSHAERIAAAVEGMAHGPRGRPHDDTVESIAQLVAVALKRDGVRCTTYENGTLANVLGIVFRSLDLPDRASLADILQKVARQK